MSINDKVAFDNLQNALTAIIGVAEVLECLDAGELNSCALSYLSYRLKEHYAAAHDAFSRIFCLDEYADIATKRLRPPHKS